MKVGDLVKNLNSESKMSGVVVRLFEKKVWRTDRLGKQVDWNKIDPEPVAEVLLDGRVVAGIPLTDLEICNESR